MFECEIKRPREEQVHDEFIVKEKKAILAILALNAIRKKKK